MYNIAANCSVNLGIIRVYSLFVNIGLGVKSVAKNTNHALRLFIATNLEYYLRLDRHYAAFSVAQPSPPDSVRGSVSIKQ